MVDKKVIIVQSLWRGLRTRILVNRYFQLTYVHGFENSNPSLIKFVQDAYLN